jgi:DNA-directed RNA polymerase subunit RPC12/RpoP
MGAEMNPTTRQAALKQGQRTRLIVIALALTLGIWFRPLWAAAGLAIVCWPQPAKSDYCPLRCAHCGAENEVLLATEEFVCDHCGQMVLVERFTGRVRLPGRNPQPSQ